MLVAESTLSHVRQLDCALRAGIHEPVAAQRVEFGRGDDLRQFLHVRRLDIDDVETLILYIQVPEVYAEVVTADEGLAIAIHREAVDVVGMSVGVGATRNGSNYGIVMCEAGELEVCRGLELLMDGGP